MIEQLGVVALVRSAGARSDQITDELFALGRLIEANPELRGALADSSRSTDDKVGLLRGLLDGKVLPATLTLVESAPSAGHRLGGAGDLADFQQVAADVQGELLATVRSAHELSDADQTRLATALGRQYDRDVQLNVVRGARPGRRAAGRDRRRRDRRHRVRQAGRRAPQTGRLTARHAPPTDPQTYRARESGKRQGNDGAFDPSGGDPGRAPEVRRRLQAVGRQQGRGRHRRQGGGRHRAGLRPALGDGQRAPRVRGRHARHRPEPRHPRDRRRRPR